MTLATVCVQCSLRALLAQESVPSFEVSFETHEARAHPWPDTSNYQFRQLIEVVWTLDDARWQEVERGLREQGERPDVTDEDARSVGVLRDFLDSGRRSRAAAQGADLPPPIVPIKKQQGPWRAPVQGPEVPRMFLIKGRRWPSAAEGADVPRIATPAWDADRALAALHITEVPFDAANGEMLGYASGRSIAVSPIGPLPHRTRFHELAHVLLSHTAESEQHGGELTPRNLRECEAETVAMLCCAALDLPGVGESGRYIWQWWGPGKIPKRSAQRILKAVDQILEAGTSTPAGDEG